jgi:hypothetical protein
MAKATTADRKASAADVRAHAEDVRRIADEVGVGEPRVRTDGTVVVHSEQPGYRDVVALSQRLTDLVGWYVHVITDDVPGADDATPV